MRPIDPAKFLKDVTIVKHDGPVDGLAFPILGDDFGPAPQLQWIEISLLRIDESYQRPIAAQGEKNVRAIIATFDWRKFAPVIVSPIPGGLYAIVDGQHRTTGASAVGLTEVPCQIILADRREQALAFNAINGLVTKVTRAQQYKAALTGGDEMAERIAGVADRAGIRIIFNKQTSMRMKPGDTMALDAVKRAILKAGDEIAVCSLKAVMASAGELGGYLRAPIISAVVEVMAIHPKWVDDDRLEKAFSLIDLDDEWRKASSAAAQKRGVITGSVLQSAIIRHLDKTLPEREPTLAVAS